MNDIDNKLCSLSKSRFRSNFHLNKDMKEYVKVKGMDKIREHAFSFINNRLKPDYPKNDGKQTPMKGHPVFIAQHACACCCRTCLEKWHHIPRYQELTTVEVSYIVNLLMEWVKIEMTK